MLHINPLICPGVHKRYQAEQLIVTIFGSRGYGLISHSRDQEESQLSLEKKWVWSIPLEAKATYNQLVTQCL